METITTKQGALSKTVFDALKIELDESNIIDGYDTTRLMKFLKKKLT